jgi:hypothetical protein
MSAADPRQDYRDEYFKLQDQYEDFDRRSLQIKGWIGSAAVAGVALNLEKGGPKVWIAVAVVAASIWLLEAFWKMFQYGFRDRIRVLEGYFRSEPNANPIAPFQIYHWWFQTHVDDAPIYPDEQGRPQPYLWRFAKAMAHPFVFLPYLPIIVMCVFFFCDR